MMWWWQPGVPGKGPWLCPLSECRPGMGRAFLVSCPSGGVATIKKCLPSSVHCHLSMSLALGSLCPLTL